MCVKLIDSSNTWHQVYYLLKNLSKPFLLGLLSVVLVTSIPMVFSSSLGDEWNSIKSFLSDGEKANTLTESLSHVNDAHSIYTNNFKMAASEVDSESDVLIENAFDDIIDNHTEGDSEMASLNRQIVDKTIYKIAYMKMELAVEKNEFNDFITWYSVLDKKFSISEKDYKSNNWISEIKSTPSTISSNGPAILEELLEIFKLKTIEELEEAIAALEKEDVQSAKKFAYEGLYYYRTLHPAIEEKMGVESANELLREMKEAVKVTMSDMSSQEMKSEIEHISDEVEIIIREYEGGNITETGLALSGIKDRLNLVEAEYFEAVKDGKIIDQEEYDETVVFLAKVIEIFTEHEQSFMNLSNSDTLSLEKNFDELEKLVSGKGNPTQVSILVGKSINNISTLEDLAGGAVQIDTIEYIIEIERLLNEAKAEYRSGNSALAFDLVSEAYLENYEFVEDPLGEADHELMEKIETDMREDLRSMIQSKVSPDKVDAQIDMILVDLSYAKTVVPEFGSVVLIVLLVSIVSVVVLSRKFSLLTINKF